MGKRKLNVNLVDYTAKQVLRHFEKTTIGCVCHDQLHLLVCLTKLETRGAILQNKCDNYTIPLGNFNCKTKISNACNYFWVFNIHSFLACLYFYFGKNACQRRIQNLVKHLTQSVL